MPELATLCVDHAAIASNTRAIAALVGVDLMAVLKADGYGHGDLAATALANGATSIGVTSIDEALVLRGRGVDAPILSWLNPLDAPYGAAVDAHIDLAVSSVEQLHAIAFSHHDPARVPRIHLHIDVGMTREGAPPAVWSTLCRLAHDWQMEGRLRVVGIMGHLSQTSGESGLQVDVERLRFRNAIGVATRSGLRPTVLHLAATQAALAGAECRFTVCRIGAGLVGIDPSGRYGLRKPLTLTAPVISVRDVRAGTGVGYAHDYVTGSRTRLAVVPVGYGDGLPRRASGRARVRINALTHAVVGAISMDQIIVDVGDATVEPGDTAVVFGNGDSGEPTTGDWANWADTIENEIVTQLGSRRHRMRRVETNREPSEVS